MKNADSRTEKYKIPYEFQAPVVLWLRVSPNKQKVVGSNPGLAFRLRPEAAVQRLSKTADSHALARE